MPSLRVIDVTELPALMTSEIKQSLRNMPGKQAVVGGASILTFDLCAKEDLHVAFREHWKHSQSLSNITGDQVVVGIAAYLLALKIPWATSKDDI